MSLFVEYFYQDGDGSEVVLPIKETFSSKKEMVDHFGVNWLSFQDIAYPIYRLQARIKDSSAVGVPMLLGVGGLVAGDVIDSAPVGVAASLGGMGAASTHVAALRVKVDAFNNSYNAGATQAERMSKWRSELGFTTTQMADYLDATFGDVTVVKVNDWEQGYTPVPQIILDSCPF